MGELLDEQCALFAQHLPDGWSLEEELAVLATLPLEKQQVVRQRLVAIDEYLRAGSEGSGDVEAASAALGVGRRQLFHLVAKVRQLGPTRALSPGYRNVARRSVARSGLPPKIDAFVSNIIARDADVRIAAIEDAVRRLCEAGGEEFPGGSAIRRRVHALRRITPARGQTGVLGAEVTSDQVYLDLSVRCDEQDYLATVTLIIDHQTRLILGHGLAANYSDGDGLRAAIKDLEARAPALAQFAAEVAPRIERFTWVVPRDLEFASHMVSEDISLTGGPIVKVVESGPRRHGAGILRLIGDRLPPFSFKPLAMERDAALASKGGIELADARRLVEASVERWNERICSGLVSPGRLDIGRRNALKKLAQDLRYLLEPVFQSVVDVRLMFEPDDGEGRH